MATVRSSHGGRDPHVLLFGATGDNAVWALTGDPEDAGNKQLDCVFVFDLRAFHGAMMFLSWGVLLPFGAAVARYGRKLKKDKIPHFWFKVSEEA